MLDYYEPEKDTYLLIRNSLRVIDSNNYKDIIEVGVGSGEVILAIEKKFPELNLYGSDINIKAVKRTKSVLKISNAKNVYNTSFFNSFKDRKFDLILFNAPYLPLESNEKFEDLKEIDRALYGGKQGYEVIEEFLKLVPIYMKENSTCLLVFSSLSNLDYIKNLCDNLMLDIKGIDLEKVFFEEIYCLEIRLNSDLIKLNSLGYNDLNLYSKGKHSKVYLGVKNNQPFIIKRAINQVIVKETFFLEKLQSYDFVPRLYFSSENFVIMEHIKGTILKEFLFVQNKSKILKVLNEIIKICMKLDDEGINKFELTNPYKHILITDNLGVKFIDFERSIFTNKPKNTTQFLQYIRKNKENLSNNKIEINIEKLDLISSDYKKNKINTIDLNDVLC